MHSDAQIIQNCLKGDQLACKQLYERYISYCYGICNRYSVRKGDLKDVIQIIFSQVFRSLKNYDSNKAVFKTWFTHVCINNILAYKRKQSGIFQTQSFEEITAPENFYYANNTEENINKQYILELLKTMPVKYQVVFNMFVIDGYSHEEIANKLDISVASSRVTLSRARAWVKEAFVSRLNS